MLTAAHLPTAQSVWLCRLALGKSSAGDQVATEEKKLQPAHGCGLHEVTDDQGLFLQG